jgi:thymidine kinase
MFLEPNPADATTGWIEVICGSMFSGKTEELIRRLRRAQYARMEIRVFKPSLDDRYHAQNIVSHNESSFESVAVHNSADIVALAEGAQVVGLDEAQFFDDGIVEVANHLAFSGKRVIVAGLDMDYLGRPFGPMPQLLAVAEYVTKLHAVCIRTGAMAQYSHRRSHLPGQQVLVGETESYEPVSRAEFARLLQKELGEQVQHKLFDSPRG